MILLDENEERLYVKCVLQWVTSGQTRDPLISGEISNKGVGREEKKVIFDTLSDIPFLPSKNSKSTPVFFPGVHIITWKAPRLLRLRITTIYHNIWRLEIYTSKCQKLWFLNWKINFPDIWGQLNLFQLSPPPVANYHICSWNRRWIISGGMTSIRKLVSLSRSGVVAPEVWTLISRFLWRNLDKELSWGHLKNVFWFSLFLKGKLLGVNIDLICNNKDITLRHSVHSNTWLFSGIVRCMTMIGGRQIIK